MSTFYFNRIEIHLLNTTFLSRIVELEQLFVEIWTKLYVLYIMYLVVI